jgi:hypothetical protein
MDYGAVEPQGPNTITMEYNGEVQQVLWQVSGRELSVRVDGRGITQPINRRIDPAALAKEVAKMMLSYYDSESPDD